MFIRCSITVQIMSDRFLHRFETVYTIPDRSKYTFFLLKTKYKLEGLIWSNWKNVLENEKKNR